MCKHAGRNADRPSNEWVVVRTPRRGGGAGARRVREPRWPAAVYLVRLTWK